MAPPLSRPELPVVLDTHVLLWWALDPERLSSKALALCQRAEGLGEGLEVSSISLWELAIKVKRGRLRLPLSVRGLQRRLTALGYVRIHPVSADQWLQNVELDWLHRDPADRTIVALAEERGLRLISKDKQIRNFYSHAFW